MKYLQIIVLIFVVSCASSNVKKVPTQVEQMKHSENYVKNPEGKTSYSEYLAHKTSHASPVVCVENDHDDLGHWGIFSKSDSNNPVAVTMQADAHKFQCVSVPGDVALILKVEAFAKDGIYRCSLEVKAGDHVRVHDDGHGLVCGKMKGMKNK